MSDTEIDCLRAALHRTEAELAKAQRLVRNLSLHNPDESFEDWRLVIQTMKEYVADVLHDGALNSSGREE